MKQIKGGVKAHPFVAPPEINITKLYVLNLNFTQLCLAIAKSMLGKPYLDLAYATGTFVFISKAFCVFKNPQKIFLENYRCNYNKRTRKRSFSE